VTADNWAGGVQYDPAQKIKDMVIPAGSEKLVRSRQEFPAAPVTMQSARDAYEAVLLWGGASLPKRDAVDLRVIDMVRTGRTTTKSGIIDSPADVGGWPKYTGDPALDSDGDGIPDGWEKEFGLDPKNAADASQDKDGDGYTNLEEYLNGTDPTVAVDYTQPKNNVNVYHQRAK
jgi:hypothetical protein